MERNWHHQKRKPRERDEKDVQTNSHQQERLSRFRGVRSKLDQEKVAASDKYAYRTER